jgi:hypothetical protein
VEVAVKAGGSKGATGQALPETHRAAVGETTCRGASSIQREGVSQSIPSRFIGGNGYPTIFSIYSIERVFCDPGMNSKICLVESRGPRAGRHWA